MASVELGEHLADDLGRLVGRKRLASFGLGDLLGRDAAAHRQLPRALVGELDVIEATSDGQVLALRPDGTPVPGWPVSTDALSAPHNEPIDGSPPTGQIVGAVAVGDVEVTEFPERFDYAFSRFGTMFFANPVAALRNVRHALIPGGRLCMVVWRRKIDNEWLHRAETVVERFVTEPEESDEPTCGPGPFAMADADTTSQILLGAGFEDIELRRCDLELTIGRDLEQAVEFVMALGPAGEVIRLAGDQAEHLRPQIEAALREALSEFARPDGVHAAASTWIVGARAPLG